MGRKFVSAFNDGERAEIRSRSNPVGDPVVGERGPLPDISGR